MVELNLSVEIVEFDLTHVQVKLTVLGKRKSDQSDSSATKKLYQPTSTTLRMTLIELHIFLRAMLEFKGPINVTTPDSARIREPEDALGDPETPRSFLSDERLFGGSEAAE